MRTGRPTPPLVITDEERATLARWARRPTTAQALTHRVRVILSCATGQNNTRVAREARWTAQTVAKRLGNRNGVLRPPGAYDQRSRISPSCRKTASVHLAPSRTRGAIHASAL